MSRGDERAPEWGAYMVERQSCREGDLLLV
jgi:hypothetical protein